MVILFEVYFENDAIVAKCKNVPGRLFKTGEMISLNEKIYEVTLCRFKKDVKYISLKSAPEGTPEPGRKLTII